MTNKIITEKMKREMCCDAFVGREHEVYSYQLNIDNYTKMLKDLPQGEWSAELAQYKNIEPSKIPENVDIATVMIINDYQYRDRLRLLLRTEHCEMNKSKRIKDALEAQIPSVSKAADIDAAVTRRDAEIAAAKNMVV